MSSYLITVQPAGWRFEAEEGRALLLAAEDAGIVLPASCRNGTCRTCLCRVAAGEVAYLIDWPGLSPDDKRAGDTLPCVAVARSDLALWAPAARRITA
ncbi:2Fe-2S iron-sulfur cluster-binding protein [Massilia sp. P8910]|uniref:2Fe-2S iron-sulfur cluster-binding protein n=1 Tax=Massilia antarctica TaxID=2765360 RepID=UPI001E2BB624|nr:2Fe-2S iron-sulfur cluster-binding protein [Massilia antarctica]MCE3605674.1 2Fe-2S iron-sulfur cluster-binding protein [Massilia antarctica]